MKFQPHPDEHVRRSETVFGGIDVAAWELTSSKDHIVQSNIAPDSLPEFDLDIEAIRRQAQAARSAWVAGRLKSHYEAIVRRLRGSSDFAATSAVLQNPSNKIA
ncbi:MAG: hypothetical protein A3H32_03045 [Betaproteobacteria bacterium RIFCSPLOWO2_02_FULL_63_19]|nr:MAG: hypothetical protein A3H32_03045 [Betaproteobacteria bacterium RIFCSPLOWO2_02_FULL_63_19]